MAPTPDDAVLCPLVMGRARTGDLLPVLAVQMFPPDDLAARMFDGLARKVGLEPVRGPVIEWEPGRRKPAAKALLARSGRWVVTTGDEVVFDDSAAALAADAVDRLWIEVARKTERALLLIGGPAPLQNPSDLDAVAAQGLLIGGWAAVDLPTATA